MALIDDGPALYIKRGAGIREYVPPASFQVDGRDLYLFDQEIGALSISASPEDCAFLARRVGAAADSPRDIALPGMLGQSVKFPGVRTIQSIPPPDGGSWMLILDR